MSLQQAFGQAELKPFGNLYGIRIKGQLMPFNTRIVVAGKDWKKISFTAKEKQRPKFERNGDEQTVTTQIDSLYITERVKDMGKGAVRVTVTIASHKDTAINGIYFNVSLPKEIFGSGQIKKDKGTAQPVNEAREYSQTASRLSFTAPMQNFEIKADSITQVMFKQDSGKNQDLIRIYFPIHAGAVGNNELFEKTYDIKVSGAIDQTPADIKLDTSQQGRMFAGFGGNFRLQNPKHDPEVIDYCLNNMRVAWGRVEMPWSAWQPDTAIDPTKLDTAQLNIRVRKAMLMAQRLNQMNIPVIVTAWFPPAWAVEGKLNMVPTPEGIWGNPLKKSVMPRIYQSITDYILYLKSHFGIEAAYFSFNESDLGINVRQTGEEHDELIKGLGAYFESKGLKTKLLLGDNSDATTYKFIDPAMNDPQAKPYIGAVSFHSWRGWDTPTLQKWADAAKQTGLPLIVGEGSIDAQAWGYPTYFLEQSYALEEINLYTRLLAICQPVSILQWQLTSDYSPLKGGGIFGDDSPLAPTQRFWNLKQLASTPKDLYAMPISNSTADISVAALGDNSKHIYTIHLVNNGTKRQVHLSGIPASVKKFNVCITNIGADMKHKTFKVKDGVCEFKADKRSFITLVSK